MKTATCTRAAGALLLFLLASPAWSLPVVPGSTYDFAFGGVQFGQGVPTAGVTFLRDVPFGILSVHAYGADSRSVTAYGLQSPTGVTDQYTITLGIIDRGPDRMGDLFPVEGQGGFIGLGWFGKGLTLASDRRWRLTYVALDFLDMFGVGSIARFEQFLPDSLSPLLNEDPWDGYFLQPGFRYGFTGIGALGIDAVTLTMIVESVPEPATAALFGIAVVGFAFARRRRPA